MIKTIHPAITRLFQYKFCNLFGLTIQEWSLVLKSSKNKKEDCENQLHNLALSKVYIMCSCIVPRGHYTFLYQQRVNTPLPPHQLLNGDIQRPLACLAKSYLRSWLSGVGEYSRMIKKKKETRGCLSSRLGAYTCRVPVKRSLSTQHIFTHKSLVYFTVVFSKGQTKPETWPYWSPLRPLRVACEEMPPPLPVLKRELGKGWGASVYTVYIN